MPHRWSQVLKEYRELLRRYLELVLPLYVKKEFASIITKGKIEFDERRLHDPFYRRELIFKAGLNGLLKVTSQGLREVIKDINRIWLVYHAYLILLPGARDFQSALHVVDKAISILIRLHDEEKYPPVPFVWREDNPTDVKEAMLESWLGRKDQDVMLALDVGDCLHGCIVNVGWIEAFAVFLPSLDIERAEYYFREAEAMIKYFTVDCLFYDLVETRSKPQWDPNPWKQLIDRCRRVLLEERG